MAGRRKAKRMLPKIITGDDGYSYREAGTELFHGGQRPVCGVENRSSKALPQAGQSKVSFGEVGDSTGNSPGRGESLSFSSSSRRAASSRRREEPKKPK